MSSFLAAAMRAACVVLVVLIGTLTVDPAVASDAGYRIVAPQHDVFARCGLRR